MASEGKVFLVGAGPGDPGLMTVKGLECLRHAQVVVYDRLVTPRLLEEASADAERIYVGKESRGHTLSQADINRLLVSMAREGKRVVRLKGGDPFVFGRGGEEVEALVEAGIPFEVVPGVTSAVAAPAYAGIPLTHRKVSSSFTVVSGSEDPTKPDTALDWRNLAADTGTLVVIMGWEGLPNVVDALIRHGKAPASPVALVQWGTLPAQRTVVGTLSDIVARGQAAGLSPPVVAVIGDVVRFREKFRWFDTGPLFGKRVLVTRSRTQASAFSEALARLGAEPVELPAIQVRPLADTSELDAALSCLASYHWVVFTSVNGVDAVFRRLDVASKDTRAFSGVRVCAIGPATAGALRQRGLVADYVPQTYVSEAIVQGFRLMDVAGKRFLLPRSAIAPESLARGLTSLGAQVDDVAAYETVIPPESRDRARQMVEAGAVDVVTFTSSSTVHNLLALLNGRADLLSRATVACIGPVTAEAARKMGVRVDLVAREHTVPGLVQALLDHFTARGGG